MLEDVARRPPSYYGLRYCYSFIVSKAIHSPLQRGGGSRVSGAGEGLLYIYAILQSFRCVFRKASNHNLKAWVLGCKTKGFRTWKHGFQGLKPMLLQMRSINFENYKHIHSICLQTVRLLTNIVWTNVKTQDCIFMQNNTTMCINIQSRVKPQTVIRPH